MNIYQSKNIIPNINLYHNQIRQLNTFFIKLKRQMTVPQILVRNLYIPFGIVLLANILGYFNTLPVSAQLLLNSTSCVYIGCFLGNKVSRKGDTFKIVINQSDNQDDQIGTKEALKFPIIASVFLFGIYVVYKYFDKNIVNMVITLYFCLTTVISNTQMALPLFPFSQTLRKPFFSVKLPGFFKSILDVSEIQLSIASIITVILCAAPVVLYFYTKHWILNNIFGILFCSMALKFVCISSFKVGFILLWLLFFYDIFWVYGTDVMVSVAKNLDIPIKLLFPYLNQLGEQKFSMLGLGDIVLPGIFVSLCLKFDIDRAISGRTGKPKSPWEFKLTYFNTCFIGYILGIVETYSALIIFNHAQPALLFLVPMCTLSVLLVGAIKGDIKQASQYTVSSGKLPSSNESL